ncbi:MAG: Crp/Fnr family transcriptional regulator [Kiritimatiellia bacterium]
MNANIGRIISASPYFQKLSEQNRNMLAGTCLQETVSKRDYLFFEGKKGRAIYFLESGSIQLVKTSVDGKEVVIKTVEPGEIFAEVILFEQDTYPVTAIALKKSTVYKLPKREFLRLLANEGFRDDFMGSVMQRLRYLADRILYLTTYDVEDRFLQFLREHYGEKERYEVSMSKKDIAAAIGTTPETLSRLVLRLKQEGKLTWKGKILVLQSGIWDRCHSQGYE